MNFIFPNLTPGYLFQQKQNLSLNSEFYSVFDISSISPDFIIFPQRIPREDFFNELKKLELLAFTEQFSKFCDYIKAEINTELENNSNENFKLINLFNLALRYNLSNFLATIVVPENYHESRILIETAKAHFQVSRKTDCDMHGFNALLSIVDSKKNPDRIKLLILNRFIVYSFRFQSNPRFKKIASDLLPTCLDILDRTKDGNLYSSLIKSVSYRGLAMIQSVDTEIQNNMMLQAEHYARNTSPKNQAEKIVAKENLYTCLQTLTKWHAYKKNENKALELHLEMIGLDAFDSTGYSELGLFHYTKRQYGDAEKMFRKAVSLGLPGVGLNSYFLGKCLESQNQFEEAINYFYSSVLHDPQAISPFLALFSLYAKQNLRSLQKSIVSKVFENPILLAQLTTDEKNTFYKNL